MSTYYFFVCDSHRVCSDAIAVQSFSTEWREVERTALTNFIEKHGSCKPHPQLIDEHDDRSSEYDKEGVTNGHKDGQAGG